MFVGWLRKSSLHSDIEKFSQEVLIDKNLLLKTIDEDQSLSFGAYEDDQLQAIITAYRFQEFILINNLYYLQDISQEIIQRLLQILLKNLDEDEKSILFMANKFEKDIFINNDFKVYENFKKAIHSGSAVAFNFSSATAKSISGQNYLPTIKKIDSEIFQTNRYDYITKQCFKESTLCLSTQFGYQHSYALDKNFIKISPWIMENEAFSDAEKLLRGVLYHRGLKTIISIIPAEVQEITDLYEKYGFKLKESLYLLSKNKQPYFKSDSIYGF